MLTRAQAEFLRFHTETPAPHFWGWKRGRRIAWGPRDQWTHFEAKRRTDTGWTRRQTVTSADMEVLSSFWGDGFTVNDAGRAALAEYDRARANG